MDAARRRRAGLTKAQTAKPGFTVPAGQAGQGVFEAVFAGSVLWPFPCLPD